MKLRPDLVLGAPLYLKDAAALGGWRINREAFRIPINRQGTLGRNALRGFGVSQVDVALHRQFALTERLQLLLRAECFNLFNHSNFGDPVNDLNSRFFGQAIEMLGRSLGSGGVNGGFGTAGTNHEDTKSTKRRTDSILFFRCRNVSSWFVPTFSVLEFTVL